MKRGIVGGLAALLMAAGLIASAPPASAGCLSSYLTADKHCDLMGPDQQPADFTFADPPTHIDD